MNTRQDISRNKLKSGLLRGAVVAGLVSGVAAASLGGGPTANATCVGISGINIGSGCDSTIGNFALVLGTGTATAHGLFTAAVALGTETEAISNGLGTAAYAGGTRSLATTFGILGLAGSQGTNVQSQAGAMLIPSIGNLAFNIGGSNPFGVGTAGPVNRAVAAGAGNIAGNLFGNKSDTTTRDLSVNALGIADFALNTGGDDNTLNSLGVPFGAAFNLGGSRNIVQSTGAFPFAGTIGVNDQTATQNGFGIDVVTKRNAPTSTNVLAAGGTQGTLFRLNPTGSNTNGVAATSNLRSGSPGGPVLKSIKKFRDQLAASNKKFRDQRAASNKKFRDSVNAKRGGAKAGTADTSSSNK